MAKKAVAKKAAPHHVFGVAVVGPKDRCTCGHQFSQHYKSSFGWVCIESLTTHCDCEQFQAAQP